MIVDLNQSQEEITTQIRQSNDKDMKLSGGSHGDRTAAYSVRNQDDLDKYKACLTSAASNKNIEKINVSAVKTQNTETMVARNSLETFVEAMSQSEEGILRNKDIEFYQSQAALRHSTSEEVADQLVRSQAAGVSLASNDSLSIITRAISNGMPLQRAQINEPFNGRRDKGQKLANLATAILSSDTMESITVTKEGSGMTQGMVDRFNRSVASHLSANKKKNDLFPKQSDHRYDSKKGHKFVESFMKSTGAGEEITSQFSADGGAVETLSKLIDDASVEAMSKVNKKTSEVFQSVDTRTYPEAQKLNSVYETTRTMKNNEASSQETGNDASLSRVAPENQAVAAMNPDNSTIESESNVTRPVKRKKEIEPQGTFEERTKRQKSDSNERNI